jgi:flagellar motility protein MotE (MotC chaperone)
MGAAVAVVAYVTVGGLPGALYAAGICLFGFIGAVAILAGRTEEAQVRMELEEHRRALANLATKLSRETEVAQRNAGQLEQRIRELEAERDGLVKLVAEERERFERTLDELGGGIGRHGNELAELERELEALIAR